MNRSMRIHGMRLAVLLLGVFWSASPHASILSWVTVDYDGGEVSIDYSALEVVYDIEAVRVTRCGSAPADGTCTPAATLPYPLFTAPAERFRFSDKGLFLIELLTSRPFSGTRFPTVRVWKQFVVNLETGSPGLIAAAETHAPLYSFHPDERYFPVSVETLFGSAAREDFLSIRLGIPFLASTLEDFFAPGVSLTLPEILRGNGHIDNRITLTRTAARRPSTRGSRDAFPIYWFVDQADAETATVTYFALFAYDEKIPAYVGNELAAPFGDHAIDRESVSISFRRMGGDRWEPTEVTFAGHLPSQRTTFLGCADPAACNVAGGEITAWDGGGTRVSWLNASRQGLRPIVYVAHGSHAMTPAFGFYGVDASIFDSFDIVGEPAGGPDATPAMPQLIELDLGDIRQAPLTFSGGMIAGPTGKWFRLFPFLRFPTAPFDATLGRDFDECVRDGLGCSLYIERVVLPPPTDTDGDGVLDEDDDFPDDPAFSSDRDGDGVPDQRDAFADDPTETTDLNGDGVGDNASPVPGLAVVRGTLTDRVSGAPVRGALIRVEIFQNAFARDGIAQTRSAADGSYSLPIELESLPATFAMTVSSPAHVPRAIPFRRPADGAGRVIDADLTMMPRDTTVIAIESEPVLHHLGDDTFGGVENSQFQRASEGQVYRREFSLSADQLSFERFTVSFLIKGVQSSGTAFEINDSLLVPIPASEANGEFSELTYEGRVADILVRGVNSLDIGSGRTRATGDFDDFEFVNPIITLR